MSGWRASGVHNEREVASVVGDANDERETLVLASTSTSGIHDEKEARRRRRRWAGGCGDDDGREAVATTSSSSTKGRWLW